MPDIERIRRIRAEDPALIGETVRTRRRRPLIAGDGRLFIIAADHPARGSLSVGGRGFAMGSRVSLLERLAAALARPGVDGVLGTPDIIEDLALLGALDDKVVVGSMNRGGLQGATFEMDDRFTAYDVPAMVRDGIDLGKLLVRVNLEDAGTASVLENSAAAVSAAAAERLPVMLEPFMSCWRDGRIVNDLSTDAVVRSVAIAAGLGDSSAYTWLKLPVVADMERVAEAATMPTLLLGGDPTSAQDEVFASWQNALALPGIRGLVVGRTLLYPHDDDVVGAVDIAASLVHGTVSTAAAAGAR
ncbi:deoxyribose-phosphate aldolase [Microbacterium sp. 1.5R]|uniref:Cgl0159 family (beta/alpha)8-fold protein n=1 Tax=Microbacterium sp. 1.5R TaxID=1916917 RepID=UPI0011A8AA24|nr:deoxyribose-phosphate aldolase [Microbacterium sp. 1.5R]